MAEDQNVLIGVDAGTSVIKAVAFDTAGRQLAMSSMPNCYQEGHDGSAVQPMARTWEDCAMALRRLGDKIDGLAGRTIALAVTGQGDGTWLVDKDNQPVADAWIWLDARAAPTVRRLARATGERSRFEATGTGLNACQQGVQLAHIEENQPELLDRASVALHCKDWLYLKLTGERATDPSEASFTFGNFRTRQYDDTVIESLGLRSRRYLLPPILDGSSTTHKLSPQAARQTGLIPGTPVSLGYVDMALTGMGSGVHTGELSVAASTIGSTGVHMRAVRPEQVFLNDEGTGYVIALPVPDLVTQVQTNMAASLNIDWLLNVVDDVASALGNTISRGELVARMEDWLVGTEPGAVLYHPYISAGERGPFIEPDARAGFIGLSSAHRFPDLLRAVVEGLALAARDCYRAMGDMPEEVRLTGGAARSEVLRGIFAAALGTPVRICRREETGAAGAAMMAAVATGVYATMEEAIATWVKPLLGAREDPDPTLIEPYDRLYAAYLDARGALPPVWKRMAENQRMRQTAAAVGATGMLSRGNGL